MTGTVGSNITDLQTNDNQQDHIVIRNSIERKHEQHIWFLCLKNLVETMERHWKTMAECIGSQDHIVFIDDPVDSLGIRVFKLKSVTISWEFMYTRSMFETDGMSVQGKLLSTVAGLLDKGTLVTTRQKTVTGLTPENIQAMHVIQESGTMMGKQVLIL